MRSWEKDSSSGWTMYVLDSSALIEVIEEYPLKDKVLGIVGDAPLVTTSISLHELFAGAHTEREKFILEHLLGGAQIVPHDAAAAKMGAQITRELSDAGKMINRMDTLIAGICKVHNAELITLDRDFAKIKGLKLQLIS